MTMFQVIESCLFTPLEGTVVGTFDTRKEADDYITENEDDSYDHGYALFVQSTSDK